MKVQLILGIVEGDKKRALEDYVDPRLFSQRESYDEYYIDAHEVDLHLDINDLQIIAENFKVTVFSDSISIEDF